MRLNLLQFQNSRAVYQRGDEAVLEFAYEKLPGSRSHVSMCYYLFTEVLKKCSRNRLIDQGKQLHGVVEKLGLGFDLVLNNDLIDMYAKCGTVELACLLFDRMPQRNVVSWTALWCCSLKWVVRVLSLMSSHFLLV